MFATWWVVSWGVLKYGNNVLTMDVTTSWNFFNHSINLCQCQGSWKYCNQEWWSIPHTLNIMSTIFIKITNNFTLSHDIKSETKYQNAFTSFTLKLKQYCSLTFIGSFQFAMHVWIFWCFQTCPSTRTSIDCSKNHGVKHNGNK
jgi:hypothetical protein